MNLTFLIRAWLTLIACQLALPGRAGGGELHRTRVTLADGQWCFNGAVTHRGTAAEGLLLNVRMVNAVFEDRHRPEFDSEANTDEFIAHIPDYAAQWVSARGFQNVLLEIANEYPHSGFVHTVIRDPAGQASLIRLAKATAPGLLVSASGYGDGKVDREVAEAADFLLPHWNGTAVADIPGRIAVLQGFGKPIVCNEDDKKGAQAVAALMASVEHGASYGLMLQQRNQTDPFTFEGASDAPVFYARLRALTAPARSGTAADALEYFPSPESQGGWRALEEPAEVRRLGGMDPVKLDELREWLYLSDDRDFAAVVIRHGYLVLEVERGNSAKTDARRVASVSKAVCATVLAIASEWSQQGRTPREMTFEDRAFDFIPWAQPWSDPRKGQIRVKQLLNHTSGICPEATGAPNDGSWEYILGHTDDTRTARLAFDPGTACGYSTHALAHASLVCETVTGMPYDQFAIQALFQPLGIEHWWFQYYDGGESMGRHPSHGLGLPARDLARIAYCMLRGGRWGDHQIIPKWFVDETGAPTHEVTTPEMRWQLNPRVFSHGWELPARHQGQGGRSGQGIPMDARSKPGSGGQLIAFVPSLDLVIARQTGTSGDWAFEEFLRRACAAADEAGADPR